MNLMLCPRVPLLGQHTASHGTRRIRRCIGVRNNGRATGHRIQLSVEHVSPVPMHLLRRIYVNRHGAFTVGRHKRWSHPKISWFDWSAGGRRRSRAKETGGGRRRQESSSVWQQSRSKSRSTLDSIKLRRIRFLWKPVSCHPLDKTRPPALSLGGKQHGTTSHHVVANVTQSIKYATTDSPRGLSLSLSPPPHSFCFYIVAIMCIESWLILLMRTVHWSLTVQVHSPEYW